ncbi:hypothetical protein SBOR_9178 [Sclerotinia borealis F-4128]|uniref:Zn(2)-C6 fungal-type domain-containing protein n=1 Tax=Sclerotinia borealis (strain F-4128) TaxID=1432307 RepID=W9C7A2_SCLBF|nr:hypothetical protein SBOR_9178 [Sclerotinia borealis F-4128]
MSSKRVPSQMTDRPSNPAHRFSEVIPRFQTLSLTSAANQAKTEYRQGEFLEELVKQRYLGRVAEDHVTFIRDSFTSLNKRIGELHKRVPIVPKRFGKTCATEEGMDAKMDDGYVNVDDDKDGDYNGDGGVVYRLTAEQEEEDEEHWRQTVTTLPKRTTITDYYVEMGYQMSSSPPKVRPEEQSSPLPRCGRSVERKPRAQKWVPRMPKNRKRPASPSPTTETLNTRTQNAETIGHMYRPEAAPTSSSVMSPPKRAKTASSPLPGPRPKRPPRCASCMRMRKLCDRKSPCGRCSGMRIAKDRQFAELQSQAKLFGFGSDVGEEGADEGTAGRVEFLMHRCDMINKMVYMEGRTSFLCLQDLHGALIPLKQ